MKEVKPHTITMTLGTILCVLCGICVQVDLQAVSIPLGICGAVVVAAADIRFLS